MSWRSWVTVGRWSFGSRRFPTFFFFGIIQNILKRWRQICVILLAISLLSGGRLAGGVTSVRLTWCCMHQELQGLSQHLTLLVAAELCIYHLFFPKSWSKGRLLSAMATFFVTNCHLLSQQRKIERRKPCQLENTMIVRHHFLLQSSRKYLPCQISLINWINLLGTELVECSYFVVNLSPGHWHSEDVAGSHLHLVASHEITKPLPKVIAEVQNDSPLPIKGIPYQNEWTSFYGAQKK